MFKMTHKTSLVLSFIILLSSFVNTPRLFGTIEGGALLKGNVLSSDINVIPEASASSLAIKCSDTDIDPGTFDFNASTPPPLKDKASGDYFLSFTGPISENAKSADKRSQVHFFAKKNGSVIIQTATARSTYILYTNICCNLSIF
jgi:hypothetical protein